MFDEQSFAFRHGFTVSDKILTAIGCAVICQSHIESQLSMLIMTLSGMDFQRGCALTSGMSFKNLCAALSSLVLQVIEESDSRYKRVKELMGQIQHFEEFRNQVAHSIWAHSKDFHSERAHRTKVTARQGKGVKFHWEEVEIAQISDEINKANKAIVELTISLSEWAGKPIQRITA